MPRTIIQSKPSRLPVSRLARKPAIAPTTIHETRFMSQSFQVVRPVRGPDVNARKPVRATPPWWPRARPGSGRSGRLAAEDRDRPDHDHLENGPADEGQDRG